jgi:hypothetical protein
MSPRGPPDSWFSESRRSSCQNKGRGVMVRRNFEDLRGLIQTVDFIQHHALTLEIVEKSFRVIQQAPDPWELAVEILDIPKALANASLANAPDPRKPQNRPAPSCLLYPLFPKIAAYHWWRLWHIVASYAIRAAIGTLGFQMSLRKYGGASASTITA